MKKIITLSIMGLFLFASETLQCAYIENDYVYESVDDEHCKDCNPRPVVRLKTKEAF